MSDEKPRKTGTMHTLSFEKLSPRDFERLCLWLVEREGYERAEHLGAAGSDQGFDIAAWRGGAKWGFQCKRVRRFGPKAALAEIEKALRLPERDRPVEFVFIVTCDVSANTRKQARARCATQMECHFWAGTELDEKVKSHPEIAEEFFLITPSMGDASRRYTHEQVTRLRVFVASPGDVSEERKRLRKAIDELNDGIAKAKGLVLDFVSWETDAWPGVGQDAQEVINREIGPYDIFVGIMWKRFGRPTHRAGSGTEEEFKRAYSLWSKYGRPHIMFYFNKAKYSLSSPDEVKQVAKVLDFKKRIAEKGVLYWEYGGPEEFEELVRKHLTKEILRRPVHAKPMSPRPPKLPSQLYEGLFNELDMYITQFEQLGRDYDRELKGEQLVFAADFSELHDYMYPYSPGSPRSALNRYVFNAPGNRFTLMPGAAGELLTDLERALPSSDVLEADPLTIYEDVARFIYEFPTAIDNEQYVIELYGRAEAQLRKAWGALLDVILKGVHRTAFDAVKSLMNQGRLSPIRGIEKITDLPSDVQLRAQWVRSDLNQSRPTRRRNNQVDAIDFAVTWLMNEQQRGRRRKYLSIYTQSTFLISACTARQELRWKDDYLVREAQYLKLRTRLQELLPSPKHRREFVVEWAERCRELRREIAGLVDIRGEPPELVESSLRLLTLYRQFDEECRIPLAFTEEAEERERLAAMTRAAKLYALFQETGEFKGRAEDAHEFLKAYLRDLQERLVLFAPDKVRAPDAKQYMENLAKWLDSEVLKESSGDSQETKGGEE
jgi:hypothetical protein